MAKPIQIGATSIILIGGLIWWQQDMLKQQWQKLRPTPAPTATQTTVYTWKDKDGTVHYSNTPDHQTSTTTVVDTGKINRLEPLPQKEEAKPKDKLLLMEMREELEQNRNKMQAAREQKMMDDIHR